MAQSPRIIGVLATILLAIIPLASADCYDRSGNVRTGWLACDPDASISSCCSSSDFCMSNGLCLNAGGNQAYTQQGCTDKKWGLPCNFYCPKGDPSDGLYYIEYCWRGFDEPANSWCCGVDCCSSSGGTATSSITIPIANDVYRPGARDSTAVTRTVTVGAGSTVTVTQGASSGASGAQQDGGAVAGNGSAATTTLALGLGLGLGIPLLVASAAALWMFFKKGKQQKQPGMTGAKDISGMEVAPQQSPQQYNWAAWEEQQQLQHHQYGKADVSELGIASEPAELSGRQSHLKH